MSKGIVAFLALLAAFALGRYTVSETTKVETHETDKKSTDKEAETNKHKETKVIEVTAPDGSKTTTTTTVEDSNRHLETTKTEDTEKHALSETTRNSSNLSLSILAGLDATDPTHRVYGAAITKDLIGPITIGAWGLTNKTVGVSLGLRF